MKTRSGLYAIPGLVSGINVNSSKGSPNSGGEESIQIVSPEGSRAERVQLCNKVKGIVEIDIDCTVVGGALPISSEDIQSFQQPQPPILETIGGQVQKLIFMPGQPSVSYVDSDAFAERSLEKDSTLAPGVEPPIEGNSLGLVVVN